MEREKLDGRKDGRMEGRAKIPLLSLDMPSKMDFINEFHSLSLSFPFTLLCLVKASLISHSSCS